MNNRDYGSMLVRRSREASCFIVRSGDISKQVAHLPLADDLEVGQR
jgi:hypothetical protein